MDFKEGDVVFFMHPEHSWIVGTVTAAGKVYSCKARDDARKVVGPVTDKLTPDQVIMCREDVLDEDVHDLLSLTILHDSTLLRCLYVRYMKDIIYTNIGAIVVALNPFNFKIPRYMDSMMPEYLKEGERIEINVPHSWAQAHNTFNEMMSDHENQCVLISGESGAGKTEATKIVMKYLAAISCLRGTEEEKAAGMMVGTKLSACSPILEAFGNARTVRNNNSSRFGKFMKVKFSGVGILVGAHVTKYLLEKSRIVTSGPKERVYHAFYLVCRGKDAAGFGLEADTNYKNLTAGNQLDNPDFSTAADYQEVVDAMSGVGMTAQEVLSIWRTTAGIMSILNTEFDAKDQGSEFKADKVKYLDTAIKCWMVKGEDLKREMLTTTYNIKGEITVKQLNPTMGADVRDGVAKAMYDNTFQWLVDKCNQMCDVEASGNWIGALDIFGFEDFEINSFEQICINLANETLQNHYNTYIFSKDMEECRSDGIDVAEVKCPDNGPCLNLVSGKGGILALLDEECAIGDRGSDLGFLDKIAATHEKNPFFEKKKLAKTSFIVKHYAGNVSYEVAGWLEKNRDSLKDAIKVLMRESTDPLTKILLPEPVERTGKALTVGGFFKSQVQALMDVINSTNPHWIRCVKPHPAKKPLMLSGVTTMAQLESSGVLGTVKIRKAGYPVRTPFEKFCKRYGIITPKEGDFQQWARKIVDVCGLNDKKFCQIGNTKVFMKSESVPSIERQRMACFGKWAGILQRTGRGFGGRLEVFGLYWEKNKIIIEQKKKEREAQERAKREAEEAERKKKEAEEREAYERDREAREARERAERAEKERIERETRFQRGVDALELNIVTTREQVLNEEMSARDLLRTMEFQARMKKIHYEQRVDLELIEQRLRKDIAASWREITVDFLSEAEDLRKQAEAEKTKVELWNKLQQNRTERAAKERERQERVRNKERSYVEKAILPVRDSDVKQILRHQYEETKEELLVSLVEAEMSPQKQRSPPPTSAIGQSSLTHHSPGSVTSPRFASSIVSSRAVSRRDLRVGLRIYVTKLRSRGTVIEVAPDGTGRTARIRLDSGMTEWLERDEIEHEPPLTPDPAGSVLLSSPPRGDTVYSASALSPQRYTTDFSVQRSPGRIMPSALEPVSPSREWDTWRQNKTREELRFK
eukprot:PhF_6_TR42663/c0_g1_i2/m.64274